MWGGVTLKDISDENLRSIFEMFSQHFDMSSSLKLAHMAFQLECELLNSYQIAKMWIQTAKAFEFNGQQLVEYNEEMALKYSKFYSIS